ncbi:hypothetical protein HDE_14397 [Halotydeus destructor]|nr:hypothetical protein HDE_14397 [Halotydeus destructor]
MQAENVLVYVDNLQLILGCKLFIKGRKQRWIQCLIRVISCFIAIYWLIDEFTYFKSDKIMLSVRNVSLYVCPTLAAIPVMVNSKKLVDINHQLVDMLTERQKKQFKNRSIFCIILYFTIGMILMAIKVHGFLRNDFEELNRFNLEDWMWKTDVVKWYHTVYAFVFVTVEDCFHEKQWITVSVSLYSSSLILWSMANSSFMESAIKKQLISAEDCQSMINKNHQLKELKSQLNESLAGIPLMILSARVAYF